MYALIKRQNKLWALSDFLYLSLRNLIPLQLQSNQRKSASWSFIQQQETHAHQPNFSTSHLNLQLQNHITQGASMSKIITDMQLRKKQLEDVIKLTQKALRKAPHGNLRSSKHGKKYYYYSTKAGSKSYEYISVKDMNKAKLLAQKENLLEVQRLARNELIFLTTRGCEYPVKTFESAISKLSLGKQVLVEPIWLSDAEYAAKWKSQEYEKLPFADDNKTEYYTNQGERVRSKSEIMIANTLGKFKVPYYYEFPLHVPLIGEIHPDFRVLNIRLRQEYFWEHEGMMDDGTYSNTFVERIRAMEKIGYFPGQNLIMTFESKSNPLSQLNIEENIKHYLL